MSISNSSKALQAVNIDDIKFPPIFSKVFRSIWHHSYKVIRLLFSVPFLSFHSGFRMQSCSLFSVQWRNGFFGTACYIFDIIAVINIIVFLSFCSVLLDLRDDLVLSALFDANGIMRISARHVRWLCNVEWIEWKGMHLVRSLDLRLVCWLIDGYSHGDLRSFRE